MPKLLFALLLTTVSASVTEFAPHPIEAKLEQCLDTAEGSSTHGSLACIDAAHTAWDRELNRVYAELRKVLGEPARAALRDAQRQWIVYRDAERAAIGAIYGELDGTMYLVMQADAAMMLTRKRVHELESRLEAANLGRQ